MQKQISESRTRPWMTRLNALPSSTVFLRFMGIRLNQLCVPLYSEPNDLPSGFLGAPNLRGGNWLRSLNEFRNDYSTGSRNSSRSLRGEKQPTWVKLTQ